MDHQSNGSIAMSTKVEPPHTHYARPQRSSEGGGSGHIAVTILVQHQGQAITSSALVITERIVPTLHSSRGPRKDHFGFDNPYGVNEMLDHIASNAWEYKEI